MRLVNWETLSFMYTTPIRVILMEHLNDILKYEAVKWNFTRRDLVSFINSMINRWHAILENQAIKSCIEKNLIRRPFVTSPSTCYAQVHQRGQSSSPTINSSTTFEQAKRFAFLHTIYDHKSCKRYLKKHHNKEKHNQLFYIFTKVSVITSLTTSDYKSRFPTMVGYWLYFLQASIELYNSAIFGYTLR